MLQHIYAVQAIDKSTGREETIRVWADTPETAIELAANEGRVIGGARLIEIRPMTAGANNSESESMVLTELRAIRGKLIELQNSRLLLYPRSTIAEALLLYLVYLFVLSLIGGLFIGLLSVAD